MHYKNGRVAKNGDKIVQIVKGQIAYGGILYDAIPGNDSCNGRIAVTTGGDPYACLFNCLHADDVAAATAIPDTSLPASNPLPGPHYPVEAPASPAPPTGPLAAIVALFLVLLGFSANAQTNTVPDGPLVQIAKQVESSGLLTATNYSFEPYLTYAPKAPEKVGGGFLAVYNLNNNVGLALGGDYLGQFSLVSANVTLKLPIMVGTYFPPQLSVFTNLTVTPFALMGVGTPFGGTGGSSVATIEDAGAYFEFGHLFGGHFNTGACYGQWQNAGAYSGVRYHAFFGWSHGF